MGHGGHSEVIKTYFWDEVRDHDKRNDKWVVIQDKVYDVSSWIHRHPGGNRMISHYAGQDATDAFRAFHNDLDFVSKYLKPLHIGVTKDQQNQPIKVQEIDEDFRELRKIAEKMDLFRPSITYFVLSFLHLFVLEAAAYFTLWYFGTGWIPFLISIMCYSTVQAQTGWVQHDVGHLSVFKSSTVSHWVHLFLMGFIKGVSPKWWNHMHYQHHAKPNIMKKDPDIRVDKLFVIGDVMPVEVAKSRKKSMPFNYQHRYFFIFGPPLLFPVYFQFMTFRHVITRKLWWDLAWMIVFYIKFFYLYIGLLGVPATLLYYLTMRVIESHWFTWCSQVNHIPMLVDNDQAEPWLKLQIHATCNIEKGYFNDWFTGHLNFQIEHHLFPTMPRHNLYKIAPLAKSLCEKHGVPYQVKPLLQGFKDVVSSLKHSGEIWYSAYHACHESQ